MNDYLQYIQETRPRDLEDKKYDLQREVSSMLKSARIRQGLTQTELALKAETKQPSIARIEAGKQLPSLRFLQRLALALDTYLVAPRFALLEKQVEVSELGITDNSQWAETTFGDKPIREIKSNVVFTGGEDKNRTYVDRGAINFSSLINYGQI